MADRTTAQAQWPLWQPAILFAAVVVSGIFVISGLTSHLRVVLQETGQRDLSVISQVFEARRDRCIQSLQLLSRVPEVIRLLAGDRTAQPAVEEILDRYSRAFNVSVAYVMDRTGWVVAASNRNAPDSLMGKNYSFRRYFQTAMEGGVGTDLAVGVTTGKRGFYFSLPIYAPDNQVSGVIVFKDPVEEYERCLRQFPQAYLVSREGIVFCAGQSSAVLHSLWPMSSKREQAVISSKSFGPGPFPPLLRREPLPDQLVGRFHRLFLVSRQPLPGTDCDLVLFSAADALFTYWLWGVPILGGLLALIFFILRIVREKSRIKGSEYFSQQRFRELFHHMRSGCVIYRAIDNGADFLIQEMNIAAQRIERLDAFEVNGRRLTEVFPGVKDMGLLEVMSRVWRNGNSEKLPVTFYQDGRIAGWRDNYVYRLSSAEVVVIYDDLTKEKQIQDELVIAESRYRSIFDNSAVAIMVADAQERVVSWNGYAERLLLRDDRLLRNIPVQSLYPPEEWEKIRSQGLRSRGSVYRMETKMICGDESIVEVDLSLSVVKSEDGSLLNTIGIVQDISGRKDAERQMRRAHQLTAQANRIKGEFLAHVSHEIRTPMNAINGYAQLLTQTNLDSVQRGYVQTMCQSMQLLLDMLNNILDFSKIEAGRIQLEQIVFDLRQLIQTTRALIVSLLADKHIELQCEVSEKLPARFIGDPTRLRQVLLNLLSNAAKFTVSGRILVRVEAACPPAGKLYRLRISVQDTGIGIEPKKLGQLFAPFAQAESSTTRRFGGSGLGLAISKALVECMGGWISAQSELGVGTTFIFEVPLEYEHAPVSGETADITCLEGKRVMIIDANVSVRQEVRRCCESVNMQVVREFENAAVAMGWLRTASELPDVIFSDILMDGMDGYEFAGAVAAEPAFAAIRLVALTRDAAMGAAFMSEQYGFAAYLTKPVTDSALIEKISMLFSGGAPAQKLPEQNQHQHTINNLRVLIVEDNPVNSQLLQIMLKKIGCLPAAVDSGRAAVEYVQTNPVDCIIMDVQMPEMSGLTATELIRQQQGPHIGIIGLSAGASPEDRVAAQRSGMDDYLTKPIQAEQLQAALRKWRNGSAERPQGDPRYG